VGYFWRNGNDGKLEEAFIDKYYPAIDSVGWKQAFKQTFGMSIDNFYVEFDQFMKQPIADLEDFLKL